MCLSSAYGRAHAARLTRARPVGTGPSGCRPAGIPHASPCRFIVCSFDDNEWSAVGKTMKTSGLRSSAVRAAPSRNPDLQPSPPWRSYDTASSTRAATSTPRPTHSAADNKTRDIALHYKIAFTLFFYSGPNPRQLSQPQSKPTARSPSRVVSRAHRYPA